MQLKPLETPPVFTGLTAQEIGTQVKAYMERLTQQIEENNRILGDAMLTDQEKKDLMALIGK